MLIFLQLYLAHLIADFLLQPDWIARNKHKPLALIAHAAIHFGVACATVNTGLSPRIAGTVALLTLVHMVLDYAKAKVSHDTWIAFTVDQAAHLVAVGLASLWLATGNWRGVAGSLKVATQRKDLFLYLSAYVAVVFGGSFFVQKVSHSFLEKIGEDTKTQKPGLPSAGKYIGWVERALILTFVVSGYVDAIGFLLAAKALARYPEIKHDEKGHFAEYFLVGTLTSVGLALVGGLVVVKLLPKL